MHTEPRTRSAHEPAQDHAWTLCRTVRVNLTPDGHWSGRGHNGYAGHPAPDAWGFHLEFEVRCVGPVRVDRGYMVDIKHIDQALHRAVMPHLADAIHRRTAPTDALPAALEALSRELPGFGLALRLKLTPFLSVETSMHLPEIALVRQKFDFAASHRLHIPALSPEENVALFGKCNNPAGHGHNYQIEPCVAVRLSRDGRPALRPSDIERITDQTIIERFDHKYLNVDTDEFRTGQGVTPSVENIAMVCFNLLAPRIREASPDAELRCVTVWETDRTSSTFPATPLGS